MLEIVQTSRFKKDYKKIVRQGKDTERLKTVIRKLQKEESLDAEYKDHPLHHNWSGFRECHIEGDWVLVYKINKSTSTLFLSTTGTHRDTLKIE